MFGIIKHVLKSPILVNNKLKTFVYKKYVKALIREHERKSEIKFLCVKNLPKIVMMCKKIAQNYF